MAAQAAAGASVQRSLEKSLAEAAQQQRRGHAASGAGGSAGWMTARAAVQEARNVEHQEAPSEASGDEGVEQVAFATKDSEAVDAGRSVSPAIGADLDDRAEAQAAAEAAELKVRLLQAQLETARRRERDGRDRRGSSGAAASAAAAAATAAAALRKWTSAAAEVSELQLPLLVAQSRLHDSVHEAALVTRSDRTSGGNDAAATAAAAMEEKRAAVAEVAMLQLRLIRGHRQLQETTQAYTEAAQTSAAAAAAPAV